ncbi:PcnA-like domain-containing protein [Moumouvirus maliensis]|nr:PcnA-like domain-containing protein [Moumouvirus maliensis]
MGNNQTTSILENTCVEFKTSENELLKNIFDMMQKISTECQIEFISGINKPDNNSDNNIPGYIRFYVESPNNHTLLKFEISSNELDFFKCEKLKVSIGVKLDNICQVLSNLDNTQSTTFIIKKNNFGSMYIKNGESFHKILTIDTLINTNFPIIKFQNLVTLKSERFGDILDSLDNKGIVNIKCESGDISFITDNGKDKKTITYFDAYNVGETCQNKCKCEDLLLFKDCHNLSENLKIYFGIDYIVTFRIITNIGSVYVYIPTYM